MSHSEISSDTYYYFSEKEHRFIQSWLKNHGYSWLNNTVCGACCGMYADEYWVNGISGTFKEKDREAFKKAMKEKGYECSVKGFRIIADPKYTKD